MFSSPAQNRNLFRMAGKLRKTQNARNRSPIMNKAGIQDLRVKVDDYEAPSRQLKTSHLVKQDS